MVPPCCALCCYITNVMKNAKERLNLSDEEEKAGKYIWKNALQITLRLWGYMYVCFYMVPNICSMEMLLAKKGLFRILAQFPRVAVS